MFYVVPDLVAQEAPHVRRQLWQFYWECEWICFHRASDFSCVGANYHEVLEPGAIATLSELLGKDVIQLATVPQGWIPYGEYRSSPEAD